MFPIEIDNSFREAASICMVKARRLYIENLAPAHPSVHLHFGGAVAAGLEVARRAYYEAGCPEAQAVEAGAEAAMAAYGEFEPPTFSNKTHSVAGEAIRYYFSVWPMEHDSLQPQYNPDGSIMAEWKFRIPIPDLVHPDTGEEIFLVGRSDLIGTVGGMPIVNDDKTATSLGDSWIKQWDLDSQSTTYIWARQQEGGTESSALFRGISILKPKLNIVDDPEGPEVRMVRGKEVRCRLEYDRMSSFGHAQAIVHRPSWMIDRWLRQLQRDIKRLIHAYLNDEWDFALHKGACAAYGGCSMVPLCTAEHPEIWAPVNFVERKWNPLDVI